MARTLSEDIERGRRAIALARARGLDTTTWEAILADLERQRLLAWASELAEQKMELAESVEYVEAPLRRISTKRVSEYAAHYLKIIASARLSQEHPALCWSMFTPAWWREREQEALGAVAALRKAVEEQGETGGS